MKSLIVTAAALLAWLATLWGAVVLAHQAGRDACILAQAAKCDRQRQQERDAARTAAAAATATETEARHEAQREHARMQRQALVDTAAAERSRIGLHQRAQAVAAAADRACTPPAAEPAGPPATAAALVLADMLGWADERAAAAAAALDAAHAAGITCEREHDAAVSGQD